MPFAHLKLGITVGGNMKEIISGVYKITNKENGHFYIGSSVDIHKRWYKHRWQLNKHNSNNIVFQKAWEKYGEEAFDFSILLICDRENTAMYEQVYLDYYKPKYNIALDALCPNKGKPLSEEHKRKIGEANSKHKMSDEQKEFLRQFHVGIPLSEEQKKKMSESQKKAHARKEYGFSKGQIPYNKGTPMSEEQKLKISIAKKGHSGGWKHTEESKIKIGLASVERGRKNKLKKQHSLNNSRAQEDFI